ncbi:MAG TPA: hypothetical protein VND45_08020 [Thermoanaerobaculia bacterium]|jgi:hypothetical protein|nr:hypothetical protein [Thermoanaerobaculia bacterium]
MPQVNVQIQTSSGGINKVTINPDRLRIAPGTTGVVIVWKANGQSAFLPGNDAFSWLTSNPTPPTVTRTDDHTLTSASYDNTFETEVVWKYMIGVEKDGVKIQVDPEVDNDPPPPVKP